MLRRIKITYKISLVFNQGRSKAEKSGGSVLIFSNFGTKLRKLFFCPVLPTFSKNWGDFPRNFPSSYGCYSTVNVTQEQCKRWSKDKHLVYYNINRLDTSKKDKCICIKYTLRPISVFLWIFLTEASEILQVSLVNLRKST